MNKVKPVLPTRAEIAYLRGQVNPTPNSAKAMRYRIIKNSKPPSASNPSSKRQPKTGRT